VIANPRVSDPSGRNVSATLDGNGPPCQPLNELNAALLQRPNEQAGTFRGSVLSRRLDVRLLDVGGNSPDRRTSQLAWQFLVEGSGGRVQAIRRFRQELR
jgi:hypothetical protein